jgi:putative membrane protein
MKRAALIATSLALLAVSAHAQEPARKIVPTIPESQIQAAELVSPFQFVSAATSVNEFVVRAGAHAEAKGLDPELKTLAARLAGEHAALIEQVRTIGEQNRIEIAAPSVDGEQKGLLGKLDGLDGEAFDSAVLEALVFAHQRAIGIYRGYADKPDALGQFAAQVLPRVIADYASLAQIAQAGGEDAAAPQKPAVNN